MIVITDQALICERSNRAAKTHRGVDRQFQKLARAEPSLPPELPSQLSAAYRYKEVADYDTGAAPPITTTQARDAIAIAERFVTLIRQLLTAPPVGPPA